MNRDTKKSQAGISLVEVLVVLVIVAVLMVVAIAQFGDVETRFQTQNIARELKINFERARFDSVKRRPSTAADMSRVVINSETSFSVTLDRDQSRSIEATDTFDVDFSGHSETKIIANGMTFPITIAFDRKGHTTAVDDTGATINPVFAVCDNCTAETITAENSFLIAVSPTGTVSMMSNGETLPTHPDPTTTDVADTHEIDTMVTVHNGTIPNGTPVPTPTPDPTPSPTANPN